MMIINLLLPCTFSHGKHVSSYNTKRCGGTLRPHPSSSYHNRARIHILDHPCTKKHPWNGFAINNSNTNRFQEEKINLQTFISNLSKKKQTLYLQIYLNIDSYVRNTFVCAVSYSSYILNDAIETMQWKNLHSVGLKTNRKFERPAKASTRIWDTMTAEP